MTEILSYLGGGYFHQDFRVVHGDADGAIRDFAREEAEDQVVAIRQEIRRLLSSDANEEELGRQWRRFARGNFFPEDEVGLTHRQWFERMLRILDEESESPSPR